MLRLKRLAAPWMAPADWAYLIQGRLRSLPRVAWLALASAALALLAGLWHLQQVERLDQARSTEAALRARLHQLDVALAGKAASAADARDFVQALPGEASADGVLRLLRRAAVAQGVVIQMVSVSHKAATVQTLGRVQLSLSLRGAYVPLKSVLAEVLDATPAPVLQSLSLQRQSDPSDLEARIELVLLSAPQRPPADVGRRE